MRHVLSSGKTVEVYFTHKYHEVPVKKYEYLDAIRTFEYDDKGQEIWSESQCPTEIKPCGTEVKIKYNGNELVAEAKCHHNDQFSKSKGRRVAYNKLTRGKGIKLQDFLNKEERKELFFKVFPQYNSECISMEEFSSMKEVVQDLSKGRMPEWANDFIAGLKNMKHLFQKKG